MSRARKLGDARYAAGLHIGAALRHARAACELNLRRAPLEAVSREAAKAVDCLGPLVWIRPEGHDA